MVTEEPPRFRGKFVRFPPGLLIAAWFLYFAGPGLRAPFSADDLMNLHGYLTESSIGSLLVDNLTFWSDSYRPLGGLFYLAFYEVFGFDPLPYRVACFALLGLNIFLLYRFTLALSGRREVALLAAFLASYHAWFIDLYYSTGTVYELLCFAFYFGAFLLYIRARQAGRLPGRWEMAALAALYICALNAKEMAATFPLFVAVYELLYHFEWKGWRALPLWPLREGGATLVTGLLTTLYVVGKLSGPDSIAAHPAYSLDISAGRFLDTFHLYLNPFLYQEHFFRDPNTVQLLLAMLAIAVWRRSRPLLFAWCFLLLSVLPVSFISHYSAFFLYLPMAGWSLYAATLLVMIRRTLVRRARLERASQVALVGALAVFLAPLHARETVKSLRLFNSIQPPSEATAAQMLAVKPRLPRGARVLFVEDPFPRDDYFLLFLTRLLYHDITIEVHRTRLRPPEGRYDAVLAFADGRLRMR